MKNLLMKIMVKIENKLGICNMKGCHNKASVDVYFPSIKVTRCMCKKHFNEFQKIELYDMLNCNKEER